jgi:hypothetical protein
MVNNRIDEMKLQLAVLIKNFSKHEISADTFCSEITRLWISYRDFQEDIKKTWEEPYDKKLIEARLQGSLSPEEFSKEYRKLWGIVQEDTFYTLLNSAHSLCSIFSNSPLCEWEINENDFRQELDKIISENQRND